MIDIGLRNKQSVKVQVGVRSGSSTQWRTPEFMDVLIRTDLFNVPSMYSFVRPGKLEWISFTPEQYKDGVFESSSHAIRLCDKFKP